MRPTADDYNYQPIAKEELPDFIGKGVHVSWARNSCWWNLEKVEGDTAHLITPRTRRKLTVKVSDLRKLGKDSQL